MESEKGAITFSLDFSSALFPPLLPALDPHISGP